LASAEAAGGCSFAASAFISRGSFGKGSMQCLGAE
jgi:hypothetical protein